MLPLVSIIIPLYNAEKYIAECLDSVINQSYRNIEVLVIDDESTDHSTAIVSHYAQRDNRIHLYEIRHSGACVARNFGIKKATGDYYQFLDADDKLDKNKISEQLSYGMAADQHMGHLLFSKWTILGKDVEDMPLSQRSVWHDYDAPLDILCDFAIIGCCLPPSSYLVHKCLIEDAGLWNEELSLNDDGEFFARVIEQSTKLVFIPSALAYYRSTPNSLSKTRNKNKVESWVLSLILTSDILIRNKCSRAREAVCRMISSCLYSLYPYYRKQRIVGERYLHSVFPDFKLMYPHISWKEIVFHHWSSIRLHIVAYKDYVSHIINRFLDIVRLSLDNLLFSKIYKKPAVISLESTLDSVLKNKLSVSRFGDGEIKLIAGKSLTFQPFNVDLQHRLKEVLSASSPDLLVCLPDIFKGMDAFTPEAAEHWRRHLSLYRKYWSRNVGKASSYGNAFITRPYMMYKDKSHAGEFFFKMRTLWQRRHVLLVEGDQSRLGVGNDLFSEALSVNRILAPNNDAFRFYSEIKNEVLKYDSSTYLILLALGPTATVLAYDLAKQGYQALDIGHLDIEYEWCRMNASKKMPVRGKYVNEAGGAPCEQVVDEHYKSEIVRFFSA